MQGGMEVAREVVERVRRDDSSRFVTCGFNLVIAAMSKSGHGLYDGAEKDQGETEGQTRPQGMSSTAFNMLQNLSSKGTDMVARSRYADKVSSPFFDLLDVAGYNYGTSRYEKDARLHPKRVIMGTKTPPGRHLPQLAAREEASQRHRRLHADGMGLPGGGGAWHLDL